MLGGKNKHQPLGYTIVEVLIVLAVSGVMFVIAANFISGKAGKTAFTQGVNEMASRIQDSIEQVIDGEYSDIPFNCSASGSSLSISATADPNHKQGNNPECVFIGKLLQFNNNGDPSSYEVFSLAAARGSTSLGSDVTPVEGGGIDLTTQQTVPQHLMLTNTAISVNGTATKYYGFGFTQSQGTAGATPGTYASGAQTVGLVYASGLTSGNDNETTAISAITGQVAPARSISFCLTDGTRYAQISVGGTGIGGQLDVSVKMKGSSAC